MPTDLAASTAFFSFFSRYVFFLISSGNLLYYSVLDIKQVKERYVVMHLISY